MSSTTLRGIFPEPKPVYRRNFMKENVKLIKRIQERHSSVQQQLQPATKSLSNTSNALLIPSKYKNTPTKAANVPKKRPTSLTTQMEVMKSHNKSVQTERFVKSPKIEKSPKKTATTTTATATTTTATTTTTKPRASGDTVEKVTKRFNKIDLENRTDTTKLRRNKEISQDDRLKVEKTGKPDAQIIREADKSGLVVLPDDERREYLRVARENYAALIKELNTMPIRNDTLRKRNRKIEIEVELKRLEEVIKIFQKPKVFVKAD